MDKLTYRIFVFLLIFSPLAFGTVEQWSMTIMESLAILAVLLLIINLLYKKEPLYEIPGITPLLLFLSYLLIQLIPLPAGIIKLVSPATYNLYSETIGIVESVKWISLSINKRATLSEFFRFSAYACFYVLTIQMLAKKEFLKKTVTAVTIFAILLSIAAILQHFTANNKIFWLVPNSSFFGPYVNRNHYAGLMEMIFPMVLCRFLVSRPRVTYKSLRGKIAEVFNQNRTNNYIIYGFSAILIAVSIFLSLSRGGMISLCLALLFLSVMLLIKGANRGKSPLVIIVFSLILLTVGHFGWEPIFERFEKIRNEQGEIVEGRIVYLKDSINIIRDFSLTGTGFGTFADIYPAYRTVPGNRWVCHAHNDYIELLTDGGIISATTAVLFLIIVFYKSGRAFFKRREPFCIYLYLAGITGILSILFHSFTDFNLHIGANGLYFFFLAGLAVSAANTRLREGLRNTRLKKMGSPLQKLWAVPVSILLISSFIFNTGALIGQNYFNSVPGKPSKENISGDRLFEIKNAMYRASEFDPLEARYHFILADTEKPLSNTETALIHYQKALQLNPANGMYLQEIGKLKSVEKAYAAADQLFRAGIKYDISNPKRYKAYADWLLSLENREKGIEYLKQAIALNPGMIDECLTLMVLYRLSDDEKQRAIPEKVAPHLFFADYLFQTGKDEKAEEAYLNALLYLEKEERIRPGYFYKVYRYYADKKHYEDALQVMLKAVEYLPENPGIRLTTAGLYEKLGIRYRAIEEYQQALVIDPGNQRAKKELDRIRKAG